MPPCAAGSQETNGTPSARDVVNRGIDDSISSLARAAYKPPIFGDRHLYPRLMITSGGEVSAAGSLIDDRERACGRARATRTRPRVCRWVAANGPRARARDSRSRYPFPRFPAIRSESRARFRVGRGADRSIDRLDPPLIGPMRSITRARAREERKGVAPVYTCVSRAIDGSIDRVYLLCTASR